MTPQELYDRMKKVQEAKKKQTVVETKEIKFRPKTDEHDLNFKIKNIKKFRRILGGLIFYVK